MLESLYCTVSVLYSDGMLPVWETHTQIPAYRCTEGDTHKPYMHVVFVNRSQEVVRCGKYTCN